MNKVQHRRFQKLIECTAVIDKKAFYMGAFAHSCGSPACIMGNYAANRKVQKSFKLRKDREGGMTTWFLCLPNGRALDFFAPEIQRHFGLEEKECDKLFSACGCNRAKTPVQAVKYLKQFYKRKLLEAT